MSVPLDDEWFNRMRELLENAYLPHDEPWRGSGFSGPAARWELLRRPVAECITGGSSVLDIGCANGYLLECLVAWCGERGIVIEPHGLDISAKLAERTRQRLPQHAHRIHTGNAFTWTPPQRYDTVRTELVYVPDALRGDYIERLLRLFVAADGALLVTEYRGRSEAPDAPTIDQQLCTLGFAIESVRSAIDYRTGREGVRVAVVRARQ